MSEHAQFAEKEETINITDRLVLGLQDQELSQKLQLESDLTLDKAVTIARQHELVKTQIKEQRHGGGAAAVDSFSRGQSRGQHRFTHGGRPSRRAKSKQTGTGTCKFVTHSRVQGVAQSTIRETVQRRDKNVTNVRNSRILHVVVKQRLLVKLKLILNHRHRKHTLLTPYVGAVKTHGE